MEYAYKPTTHGLAVQAACSALEKPLHLTRVAFGSGKISDDTNLADVHELLEYVSDGTIGERRHKDNRFEFTIQFANVDHKEVKTFLLSEFIVYAKHPETESETDFLYGTLGDYRQPVPAYNPAYPPSVFNFPLTIIFSDELKVNVSAPTGLATWDDLINLTNRLAIIQVGVTIPPTGWEEGNEPDEPKGWHIDISQEIIREDMVPLLTILPTYMDTADDCDMYSVVRTLDGALRVFAQSVPEGEIRASLALLGTSGNGGGIGSGDVGYVLPPATANRLGGVKVGPGLNVGPDGTLSVDTASEEDVEKLLTGVLPDNK